MLLIDFCLKIVGFLFFSCFYPEILINCWFFLITIQFHFQLFSPCGLRRSWLADGVLCFTLLRKVLKLHDKSMWPFYLSFRLNVAQLFKLPLSGYDSPKSGPHAPPSPANYLQSLSLSQLTAESWVKKYYLYKSPASLTANKIGWHKVSEAFSISLWSSYPAWLARSC